MPLFQVDIEKSFEGEFWTNVYYVEAASLSDATTSAQEIVDAERTFHLTRIMFEKYRVSTPAEGDFAYITQALGVPGQRGSSNTPLLPLFNVIRADLSDGIKRPSRKYYRGCLESGMVTADGMMSGNVASGVFSPLTGLLNVADLRSREGSPILNVVVFPRIGMRQLRRGSRRRTEPIL